MPITFFFFPSQKFRELSFLKLQNLESIGSHNFILYLQILHIAFTNILHEQCMYLSNEPLTQNAHQYLPVHFTSAIQTYLSNELSLHGRKQNCEY